MASATSPLAPSLLPSCLPTLHPLFFRAPQVLLPSSSSPFFVDLATEHIIAPLQKSRTFGLS